MDNESEVDNMSNETLTEIRDSLSRVLKHIEEEPETEEVVKTEVKLRTMVHCIH